MSCRPLGVLAVLAAALWLNVGSARAGDAGAASARDPVGGEHRVALVIGNSAYQSVTPLPNPANDAKAVGDLLAAAGFEVIAAPDLTQQGMREAFRDFSARVAEKGADTVALVFYAGHGLQIDGENFLVPVDARIARESDVPIQAVRLADVMNALAAAPSRTRIVLLDACRNNPFADIKATTGRGLAIVDAPTGSIVSYSTAPGMEAEDGTGADSPYTTAFLAIAREPDLPIEQAFKRMRLSVHQSTGGRQTPWESSSLTDNFSFFRSGGATAVKADRPGGVAVRAKSMDAWRDALAPHAEGEAFAIVIRADVVEAYRAFLALHPSSPFATRVRGLLERRVEMTAWHDAVVVDTVASYRTFLAAYPGSDVAATARRLMERARLRAASINAGPPGPAAANAGGPAPQSTAFTPVTLPVPVATCTCQQPPVKPERRLRRVRLPTDTGVFAPDGPPSGAIRVGGGIPPGGRRIHPRAPRRDFPRHSGDFRRWN
jgi:hypothetical protein